MGYPNFKMFHLFSSSDIPSKTKKQNVDSFAEFLWKGIRATFPKQVFLHIINFFSFWKKLIYQKCNIPCIYFFWRAASLEWLFFFTFYIIYFFRGAAFLQFLFFQRSCFYYKIYLFRGTAFYNIYLFRGAAFL